MKTDTQKPQDSNSTDGADEPLDAPDCSLSSGTPLTDMLAAEIANPSRPYVDGLVKACRAFEEKNNELSKDIARWKSNFSAFAIVHCAKYGQDHFGKDMLHPKHYDLLEEAGCRMASFKRAELKENV